MPRRQTYTTASVLNALGRPELRQDTRYGGYLARCVIGFWSLLDDDERETIAGATARLAESTNQLGPVDAFVIVNRAIARAAREAVRDERHARTIEIVRQDMDPAWLAAQDA